MNTDLTGLAGVALAFAVLLLRVPRVQALPLLKRVGAIAATLAASLIPLGDVSLAGFVRGIGGDLSIPTLALLALALLRALFALAPVAAHDRAALLKVLALVAVVFYPLALGLTMFDPYRLGFCNLWFMACLAGVALWSALRYSSLLALCMALAVAAWAAGWHESTNLWNYLIDPWLATYALWFTLRDGVVALRGKRYAQSRP